MNPPSTSTRPTSVFASIALLLTAACVCLAATSAPPAPPEMPEYKGGFVDQLKSGFGLFHKNGTVENRGTDARKDAGGKMQLVTTLMAVAFKSFREKRLDNILYSVTDVVLESRGPVFKETPAEVARLRQLASKVGAGLGKTQGGDVGVMTLASVLTQGRSDAEVLTLIRGLNQGAIEMRKLYPDPSTSKPRFHAAIDAAMKASVGTGQFNHNVEVKLESELAQNLTREIAREEIVYRYAQTKQFLEHSDPKNLGKSATQAFEGDYRRRLTASERERAEGDADAILGFKRTSDQGIQSSNKYTFKLGSAAQGHESEYSGTVADCLKNLRTYADVAKCYTPLYQGELQRPIVESATKSIPKDAKGEVGEFADSVRVAAGKVFTRQGGGLRGSDEDAITLLSAQSLAEYLKKKIDALSKKIGASMNAKDFKAFTPEQIDNAIQGLMGINGKKLGTNLAPTFKYALKGRGEKTGTLAQCMNDSGNQGDIVAQSEAKAACFKAAYTGLEEPALEWVARNFPEIPKLEFATDSLHRAVDDVYGKPGKGIPAGYKKAGEDERIQSLVERTLVTVAKSAYREGSFRLGGSAATLTQQGSLELTRRLDAEEAEGTVEKSVQGLLGRGPKPAISSSIELTDADGKNVGTWSQCMSKAADAVARGKCFEAAYRGLQEPAFEWAARNFPGGDGPLSRVSDSVHDAVKTVYGDKPDPSKLQGSTPQSRTVALTGAVAESFVRTAGRDLAAAEDPKPSPGSPEFLRVQKRARAQADQAFSDAMADHIHETWQDGVRKNAPDATRPDASTAEVLGSLASSRAPDAAPNASPRTYVDEKGEQSRWRTNAESAAVDSIHGFMQDPSKNRLAASLFAARFLGATPEDRMQPGLKFSDAKEGREKFMVAWDDLQKGDLPKGDPRSKNFYYQMAAQLKGALPDMKPRDGEPMEAYMKRLDYSTVASKASSVSLPVADELRHQIDCVDPTTLRPRTGKADKQPNGIACGCTTVMGTLKTANGTLFPREFANFLKTLRLAAHADIPSKSGQCRKAVDDLLKDIPELMKSNSGKSFFESPLAFLAGAIDKDKKTHHPSVMQCVVIGTVQKQAMPTLPSIGGLGSFNTAFRNAMGGDNMLAILDGTHPDLKGDTSISREFNKTVDDLGKLFWDPATASGAKGDALSTQIRELLAHQSQTLTVKLVDSPAVFKPIMKEIFNSQLGNAADVLAGRIPLRNPSEWGVPNRSPASASSGAAPADPIDATFEKHRAELTDKVHKAVTNKIAIAAGAQVRESLLMDPQESLAHVKPGDENKCDWEVAEQKRPPSKESFDAAKETLIQSSCSQVDPVDAELAKVQAGNLTRAVQSMKDLGGKMEGKGWLAQAKEAYSNRGTAMAAGGDAKDFAVGISDFRRDFYRAWQSDHPGAEALAEDKPGGTSGEIKNKLGKVAAKAGEFLVNPVLPFVR